MGISSPACDAGYRRRADRDFDFGQTAAQTSCGGTARRVRTASRTQLSARCCPALISVKFAADHAFRA
jgi:hypothetical protein